MRVCRDLADQLWMILVGLLWRKTSTRMSSPLGRAEHADGSCYFLSRLGLFRSFEFLRRWLMLVFLLFLGSA